MEKTKYTTAMFRNASKTFVDAILSYFNNIWKTGKHPDKWKIATIIPILKPNKDRKNINSYRCLNIQLWKTSGKHN
jgi:hypothetical protein